MPPARRTVLDGKRFEPCCDEGRRRGTGTRRRITAAIARVNARGCPQGPPKRSDRPALEQDQQRQRPGGARPRGAPLPQFDTSERPLAHPTGPMRRRPGADASAARSTGAAGRVQRVQHRRGSRHQDQRRDRSDRDDEEDRCDDLWSGHSGPRRAFSGQAKHLWLPRPQPRAGEHAPHRSRGAGEGAARSDILTSREAATCGPLRDARPQPGRRPRACAGHGPRRASNEAGRGRTENCLR
ncbi:hypothetical protein GOFOIKOB_4076 [Methylobacterium tardum]|nr:hypothetical protein GOFOIKOB_4076 [Methylobacterium tardum]